MASTTEDLNAENQFSPEPEPNKIQHGVRAEVSPDAKCPICLDRFDNMSYIDRCFHKFCFRCIQEWSRNKAECPLCKQPFNSIFHSVRTENDFQEYVLKATENGSFGSPGGQRFRYRTTLTRERRMAHQPRSSPVISQLPDNGVVFEGLGRQPRPQQGRSLRRMMTRLSARRRAQSQGVSTRQIQEQEMVNFRRELYRSGVRVRNVQDGGRYRDVSADFFRRNAACLHRLMPWLKRELCVLFGSHGSIVNIVQHIIMSNIVRYDMEGEAFQEELRPFLLSRTDHFLHEFISFARAPFNMESYDQRANYDCPAPSYEEESDSDLSVIAISPDAASPRQADRPTPNPSELALSLSQATWDDETPGPSYSVTETLEAGNSSPDEASVVSEEASSQPETSLPVVPIKADPGTKDDSSTRSGDDCLIVGYVKPLAERTPELIELSSDSEVSTHVTSTEVVAQPVHTRFHSSSASSCCLSTRSSSTRSSVSRDRWKRKKSKRKKRSKSKREKRRKKSSHSGGSTSSSGRHRARASSRVRSSSKDRSRFQSQSRDKRDLRRHQRSSSTERTTVAYSYSRSEHRAKDWSQRTTRDQSSLGGRARSASRETCAYQMRNRKRSRNRERASSTRSRTRSQNSDGVVYRHRPRSRSWSRGYATVRDRRRSRSRERTYSYMREYQERDRGFSYQWERYSYHSRTHNGHDSVTRNRTRHRRTSPCSDYRIRSSSESTSFRSPSSHREDVYYQYRNYHSRSPSSTQSRTTSGRTDKLRQEKPGGKRKYKTHYLESSSSKADKSANLQIAKLSSEIHTLPRREGSSPRPHSQCSSYSKSGSLVAESTISSEPKMKRHREKRRSSSVEIVYEGKATEASRHHERKKKHKKRRKEKSSERTDCTNHSPLVITIESDSDEVVVASMDSDNSTMNKTTKHLKNSSFDLAEQHITENQTAQDLPSATDNTLFRNTSTESLDVCGLPTDSDLTPPNPNRETCLKQEGVNPVTNVGDHENFKGQEQDNRQHCPSPRTTLSKNTSDRPPLILKIPKRFFNGTNLFNSSMENA
ncbi:E3 ubiquitin-protein ligase Topors-like isoform X1 [Pristis pectinata]|uniref:E3 ubiquitin-protein ligase Topors-like isoform X1 n=1 Tax=Pristis pectinata TaxID=685728 RepID=UPI00223DE215|nr:E3 ubiquitin-protein ligase Topors-like isoform X1 [Pristis pectinata]